jgi:hypothetical protein
MAHVTALICCDSGINARGLWSLVNTFDQIEMESFPAVYPGWDILLVLTDLRGSGEQLVEVELVDFHAELDDAANAVLWYDAVGVETSPQLSREWLRFSPKDVRFAQAGVHEIRVSLDGELIQSATLHVREA